jgi:hypothetical protein
MHRARRSIPNERFSWVYAYDTEAMRECRSNKRVRSFSAEPAGQGPGAILSTDVGADWRLAEIFCGPVQSRVVQKHLAQLGRRHGFG